MIFSERLRYLIDCEDIKIKVLAPKLNLAASTLGNYAQGTREPDFETLVRIADYFGVTTDYLLGHEMPARTVSGEKELLALLRQMSPAQRELLLEQARLRRGRGYFFIPSARAGPRRGPA